MSSRGTFPPLCNRYNSQSSRALLECLVHTAKAIDVMALPKLELLIRLLAARLEEILEDPMIDQPQ
jgi:hypothetical protein